MSTDQAPPTAVLPPKPAALWEDFVDIFYAPSAVFRRRERQSFWVPLIIVSVAMAVILFATFSVLSPIVDAEMNRALAEAMKKNPQITEDTMATMRSWGMTIARVGMLVGTPLIIFVLGLVMWVVGKLGFGSTQTLNAAMVVSTYACIPKVVGAILSGVQALILDVNNIHSIYGLSLGPARFLDPSTHSATMMALVARFDLLTIWTTVLIGIGYAVTGRMSRGRAATAAVLLWVIGSLPALYKLAMS